MVPDRVDYVIVGAGSAGCVLADRLTRDGRYHVLLVESGPEDKSPFIHMPLGLGRLLRDGDPHYWQFEASQGGNRPSEAWIKGRTLGGSSSVNGMVYVRGAPCDFDGWAAAGCTGWDWATAERAYGEMEDHALGPGEGRGVGGPLRVTVPQQKDPLGEAILQAAAQAGFPTVADTNGMEAVCEGGFGRQPRTVSEGRRFSAANAFLHPARHRPNLHVVTDTDVTGLLFEGRRASGVALRTGERAWQVAADREVILSAGAVNSPKLLLLAGIGPAEDLHALGINVRVDAPGVGANLREHRGLQLSYEVRRGGVNRSLRGPGLILSGLRYMLTRTGPLANAVFDLAGFVKTVPGLTLPDGQIGVGLYAFEPSTDGDQHPFSGKTVGQRPGFTMFGCFLRPESQGSIWLTSADPAAPPRIDANYLSAPADREGAISLFRTMRRIVAQPALAPFIVAETMPGPGLAETDEDIIEQAFRLGTPGYHVAGTCRMGADAAAPLDPDLRVRGVEGLRVVDTSVMPTMPSGNTNGPAMVVAWMAADRILAGRG